MTLIEHAIIDENTTITTIKMTATTLVAHPLPIFLNDWLCVAALGECLLREA